MKFLKRIRTFTFLSGGLEEAEEASATSNEWKE